MSEPQITTPRNVDEVFEDYAARRQGLIKALTSDVDKFFQECDPDKENLCLYGNPDSTWEVALPAEEVPPELPEPALGINFARDGMQRKDWLSLVAVHSDAWLIAVAFYFGAKFDKYERDRLFKLINGLPTVYEVLSGKANKKKGSAATAAAGVKRREPESAAPKSKPAPGKVFGPQDNVMLLQGKRVELFWPDDGLWYSAEITSVNPRNRTAETLYATGDKERLELDEVIPEGHLNVPDAQ